MKDNNYKDVKQTVEIGVAKPATVIFDHVIDLSKWWPEEFEGEALELNSEFVLKTGESHYSENKVTEFVRDKRVVWITTASRRTTDGYDWTGTKFIFELIPHGELTSVRFTYDGVVLEKESERLVQICDMTMELLNNFIIYGKSK